MSNTPVQTEGWSAMSLLAAGLILGLLVLALSWFVAV